MKVNALTFSCPSAHKTLLFLFLLLWLTFYSVFFIGFSFSVHSNSPFRVLSSGPSYLAQTHSIGDLISATSTITICNCEPTHTYIYVQPQCSSCLKSKFPTAYLTSSTMGCLKRRTVCSQKLSVCSFSVHSFFLYSSSAPSTPKPFQESGCIVVICFHVSLPLPLAPWWTRIKNN